ncbi:unnamed protein product, partial [Meganyctiphanes norvegica]
MEGEKLKPVVIGKAKRPRAFEHFIDEMEQRHGESFEGNCHLILCGKRLTEAESWEYRHKVKFIYVDKAQNNCKRLRQPANAEDSCAGPQQLWAFKLTNDLNDPSILTDIRQTFKQSSLRDWERSMQSTINSINSSSDIDEQSPSTSFTNATQSSSNINPDTTVKSQLARGLCHCMDPNGNRHVKGFDLECASEGWNFTNISRKFVKIPDITMGSAVISRSSSMTLLSFYRQQFFCKTSHARVGEHDVTRDNDGAQPQTLLIINHELELYDEKNNHNDVALLTLEREVSFNSFIQPVCLPFRQDLRHNNFLGQRLDVVGWGRTNHAIRQTSPIPLEAKVEVVTRDRCQQAYGKLEPPFNIIESQLCAGTGGTDSCNGDSGGPLHYFDGQSGRYYVVGVTSFGVECGRPDFPGVYARVGSYLSWIESKVN